MFAVVTLLLLIQEGLLRYKRKYLHRVLINCLRKSVVRLTEHIDMTIAVDWSVKQKSFPAC